MMKSKNKAAPSLRLMAPIAVLLVTWIASCASLKRFAYEGYNRDSWQKPEQVIQSLEIQPRHHVADLGAGGGYFTFRLVKAVGAGGKVYAVDVDQGMIEYLKKRTSEEGHRNLEVVLAKYDDPLLPEGGVDLIFICNTYHHIEDRVAYFKRVKRYLRPGGRVAIIDFNGKGWLERMFVHVVPRDVIRSEVEAAGYRLQYEYDFLPRQHFLVFSKEAS